MVWMVPESACHWLVVAAAPDWHEKIGLDSKAFAEGIGRQIFGSKAGVGVAKILMIENDIDVTNVDEVVWAFASRQHPAYGELYFKDEAQNALACVPGPRREAHLRGDQGHSEWSARRSLRARGAAEALRPDQRLAGRRPGACAPELGGVWLQGVSRSPRRAFSKQVDLREASSLEDRLAVSVTAIRPPRDLDRLFVVEGEMPGCASSRSVSATTGRPRGGGEPLRSPPLRQVPDFGEHLEHQLPPDTDEPRDHDLAVGRRHHHRRRHRQRCSGGRHGVISWPLPSRNARLVTQKA
jgi:hypothetical protein